MTERDALYAAVLANPADDLPRLVFADWCDDHGEPDRAEFIRAQVELDRLSADDPRRRPLEDRTRSILVKWSDLWKVSGIRGGQEFERGFVATWAGSAEWLLASASRLFAEAPVQAVRLRLLKERYFSGVCRLDGLGRVDHLDVSSHIGLGVGNLLRRLLTDAPFHRLRSLAAGNNRLFADALSQIAESPVAHRLTTLDLSGNPLSDEGLMTLARVTRLRRLRVLTVRCNEQSYEDSVHADGAAAFALSAQFPALAELDLSGHRVGDDGLAALIESPLGQRLGVLRLARNDLGGDGPGWGEWLATLPAAPRLLDLSGRRNTVHAVDAVALRDWPALGRGVTVDLRGCTMTSAAHRALAGSPHVGRLLIDAHPPSEDES